MKATYNIQLCKIKKKWVKQLSVSSKPMLNQNLLMRDNFVFKKKMKRKDDTKRVFNEEKEKNLQIESSSL